MAKSFVLLMVMMFVLSGCAASQFYVKVDSLMLDNTKTKYVLVPSVKGVSESDLQYIEFSRYIDEVLRGKGYLKVADLKESEIAIFLNYGISEPQESISTVPIIGQTGVSSVYTTGTFSKHGRSSRYTGTTTYTPIYGVTGYIPVSRTTYTRYIVLTAYDAQGYLDNKKEVQLWKTTIISSGASGDLRRVFPVLTAASSKYIATNTGSQIEVLIDENDAEVLKLRSISRSGEIVK